MIEHLLTPRGENIPDIPWNIYPRPQMVRKNWICLNGKWDFCETDSKETAPEFEKITVPYCMESLLSGINRPHQKGKLMYYKRSITVWDEWRKGRILLHFGAVDQCCQIYVNSKPVYENDGGYLPFTVDITEDVKNGENELEVFVTDDMDHKYPWGKQWDERGGIWYTPVSGIWQTVWMEIVPRKYISDVRCSINGNTVRICVSGVQEGTAELCGMKYELKDGETAVRIDEPHLWSPEDPYLYRFSVSSGADRVESYFAFRTLSIEEYNGKGRLCLNGRPYFFNGLLDQGYYSDGIYTPADPKCYEDDIMAMKAMGYNTLRKHIKIEPQQFYYDCDRLGMAVFQDMVNNGEYVRFRDSVLAVAGRKKLNDSKINKDPETRAFFLDHMEKTAVYLDPHPCIVYWTIFNEGWGQFCASEAYEKLKSIDSSRFIDSASGWFKAEKTDVESEHIYLKPVRLSIGKKPVVLSEFGGYACKVEDHYANKEKEYGYKICNSEEELTKDLKKLYLKEVLPAVKNGLSAAIFTQVSDVEDELNGFITYDRRVLKVDPAEFEYISASLMAASMAEAECENAKAYRNGGSKVYIFSKGKPSISVDLTKLEKEYYAPGTRKALAAGVITGFENLFWKRCGGFSAVIDADDDREFAELLGFVINGLFYEGRADEAQMTAVSYFAEREYCGKNAYDADETND